MKFILSLGAFLFVVPVFASTNITVLSGQVLTNADLVRLKLKFQDGKFDVVAMVFSNHAGIKEIERWSLLSDSLGMVANAITNKRVAKEYLLTSDFVEAENMLQSKTGIHGALRADGNLWVASILVRDNLTDGLREIGYWSDAWTIVDKLFQAGYRNEISVLGYADVRDKYGHVRRQIVVSATLGFSEYQKINRPSFAGADLRRLLGR
jgi:hypothetical protein